MTVLPADGFRRRSSRLRRRASRRSCTAPVPPVSCRGVDEGRHASGRLAGPRRASGLSKLFRRRHGEDLLKTWRADVIQGGQPGAAARALPRTWELIRAGLGERLRAMRRVDTDVRHAWRSLTRRPVSSLSTVFVFALGVGLLSAMFALTIPSSCVRCRTPRPTSSWRLTSVGIVGARACRPSTNGSARGTCSKG